MAARTGSGEVLAADCSRARARAEAENPASFSQDQYQLATQFLGASGCYGGGEPTRPAQHSDQ